MPDREHGSDNQRAKTVAIHILGSMANRAVRILGDLNFASVPILKVIGRTHRAPLEFEHLEFHRERCFVVLAHRVGPDG